MEVAGSAQDHHLHQLLERVLERVHHPGTAWCNLTKLALFDDYVAILLVSGTFWPVNCARRVLLDAQAVALVKPIEEDGLAAGGSLEAEAGRRTNP
jgi:hypothetical protein